MDPEQKPVDQNPVPINVPQGDHPKSSGWQISFFVLLVILIIVLGGIGYFYYTSRSSNQVVNNQTVSQAQPSLGPQNTASPSANLTWVTTPNNFMGTYTFQYPAGWHIANQWPTNYTDGITVFLDPNPLNFAPRGGPISALRMTDTSGNPNPDELFLAARNKFKAGLTDEKDEVITMDFGPVYHYWGKINYYNDLVDTEGYFFQIQGGPTDLINKHNIFATPDINTKYSDILKKIVLSFKKIQ